MVQKLEGIGAARLGARDGFGFGTPFSRSCRRLMIQIVLPPQSVISYSL
jgi:hypothetical protein